MASAVSNRSRVWLGVLAAVVVLTLAYVWLRDSRATVTVRTATAQRADLISTISTNGKVEPTADFQAHAPAPGVIKQLFVTIGQHVSKGADLIRLDASDAQSKVVAAQAQVTAAQAALANMRHGGTQDELLSEHADMKNAEQQEQTAKATLATLEALQAKGAASAAEVAQARTRVTEAALRLSQLQTRRTQRYSSQDLAAQQASLRESQATLAAARSGYGGFDIHSPISGTVYSLPVTQYDFVQSGEALLDVADLTRLEVRAYFDEPEIGKLQPGQPVKIVWDAKPNQTWHGHILQAPSTVITYGTRNVGECLITVDDATGDLLPNTNVTVTVTTSQHLNVLSLPREALRTEGMSNFVYRVVRDKLVRTPVQVGVVNLTRVEVTGGLQQGDTIALGATTEAELSDGLRVKTQ